MQTYSVYFDKQHDSVNLWKMSVSICMSNINFIIHIFLETLHFKESCNLIGQQHLAQFAQILAKINFPETKRPITF